MALLTILLFLFSVKGYFCVRDVKVNVLPPIVRVGDNITVGCSYTLDNETLINVTYLHNGREYFIYTPKDKVPIYVTALLKVKKRIVKNDEILVLQGVNSDATGVIKCVVSAEPGIMTQSPSVLSDSTFVTVVEKPQEIPNIILESLTFQVGKNLKAKCSSSGGTPLANLTWYVDGDEVEYNEISRIKHYTEKSDLNSSVSELTLPVVPGTYNDCNLSTEVVLQEDSRSSSIITCSGPGGCGVATSVEESAMHLSLYTGILAIIPSFLNLLKATNE